MRPLKNPAKTPPNFPPTLFLIQLFFMNRNKTRIIPAKIIVPSSIGFSANEESFVVRGVIMYSLLIPINESN